MPEMDEIPDNNEISQSMTPTTQEQIDNIIDHCIEIESNEKMRKEHVNRWTLRFKQPDLEEKVGKLIANLASDLSVLKGRGDPKFVIVDRENRRMTLLEYELFIEKEKKIGPF